MIAIAPNPTPSSTASRWSVTLRYRKAWNAITTAIQFTKWSTSSVAG